MDTNTHIYVLLHYAHVYSNTEHSIHLVTEIYNERDVLEIPRVNCSLTTAPGEYSYTVFVYPDRMTRVMNKSRMRILHCSDLWKNNNKKDK